MTSRACVTSSSSSSLCWAEPSRDTVRLQRWTRGSWCSSGRCQLHNHLSSFLSINTIMQNNRKPWSYNWSNTTRSNVSLSCFSHQISNNINVLISSLVNLFSLTVDCTDVLTPSSLPHSDTSGTSNDPKPMHSNRQQLIQHMLTVVRYQPCAARAVKVNASATCWY